MTRALIVEDDNTWQRLHKGRLEDVLEEDNIDITDNYDSAISMLERDHVAYILDGQFPKHEGGKDEQLGIQLAKEIYKIEGNYDKIIIVSGRSETLQQARQLGIEKVYHKANPNEEAGEKSYMELAGDLQNLLTE